MKKIIPVFFMLVTVFGAFSDEPSILDYFPAKIGTTWTYANGSGKTVEVRILKNSMPDPNDRTATLYLMESQMLGLGSTITLFLVKDNKAYIVATRNIFGQYQENLPPYPIELAQAGQEWSYNDRGDDLRYKTTKTSCSFDGQTYNDCILVEKKVVSGNNVLMTTKSYYAKGVGLVYVTVQGPDGKESIYMKLIP